MRIGNRSITVTRGMRTSILGTIKSTDKQGADINTGRTQRGERKEVAKSYGSGDKVRRDQKYWH